MEQSGEFSWRVRAATWSPALSPHSSTKAWSSDAAAFVIDCEDFDGGKAPGDLVRSFAKMLDEAPPALLDVIGERPRIDVVEAQISVAAFESAALSLIGERTGYMLSRGPDGTAVASVWLRGNIEEQTLKSADPAVALCGALALACLSAASTDPSLLRSSAI